MSSWEFIRNPELIEHPKKFQDIERCFSKSICDLRVSSFLVCYEMPVLGGFNFHGQTVNRND